jgi:hypothetical protein
LYDINGLVCTFCKQKAHSYDFCVGRESVPTAEQHCEWTENLVESEAFDITAYEGLSLDEALEKFLQVGNDFNQGNPIASGDDPTFALRAQLGFWKALGTIKQPLSWLSFGAPRRFVFEPPHLEHENWPGIESALADNPTWLQMQLATQVDLRRLLVVERDFASLVHPIGVTARERLDGSIKYRKLDDCRLSNAHEASMKHKFETIHHIPDMVRPDDLVWWLDLSDFYYQIPLHPDALRYSCFKYKGVYYASRVLLMGQKPATFWCVKITRPILAFFRSLGIRCSNYIDDWFGAGHRDQAEKERAFVFAVLQQLGFIINFDKSASACHTEGVHLGFTVDAANQRISLPPKKKWKAVSLLRSLVRSHREHGHVSRESLRHTVGTCSSTSPACAAVNCFLRSAYNAQDTSRDKHDSVRLSDGCLDELLECADYIEQCDGALFSDSTPDVTLALDAGETGFGGSVTAHASDSRHTHASPLPTELVGTSSTRRELYGADVIFSREAASLRGLTVRLLLDSKPAICGLNRKSSKVAALHTHIKHICTTALVHNIRLLPSWISRDSNTEADMLSKIWADFHELPLNPFLQLRIAMECGGHTLKCKKVGALPFFFRQRARFKKKRTALLLLHPVWTAQMWWPQLLCERTRHFDAGTFSHVFQLSPELRSQHSVPSWRFQVSLLSV